MEVLYIFKAGLGVVFSLLKPYIQLHFGFQICLMMVGLKSPLLENMAEAI